MWGLNPLESGQTQPRWRFTDPTFGYGVSIPLNRVRHNHSWCYPAGMGLSMRVSIPLNRVRHNHEIAGDMQRIQSELVSIPLNRVRHNHRDKWCKRALAGIRLNPLESGQTQPHTEMLAGTRSGLIVSIPLNRVRHNHRKDWPALQCAPRKVSIPLNRVRHNHCIPPSLNEINHLDRPFRQPPRPSQFLPQKRTPKWRNSSKINVRQPQRRLDSCYTFNHRHLHPFSPCLASRRQRLAQRACPRMLYTMT